MCRLQNNGALFLMFICLQKEKEKDHDYNTLKKIKVLTRVTNLYQQKFPLNVLINAMFLIMWCPHKSIL